MKTRIHQTRLFAALAGVILTFTLASTQAQTYTWDQQALGQVYQTCPNVAPYHWPSNNYWSQSVAIGRNCDDTADVISAPSNFSPAPPTGVYPGGPGAVGVNVVLGAPANTLLDVNVTLNSLTIQANGALIGIGGNVTATANLFDFQGDGILGASGSQMIAIGTGGTLVKSGGTGTYSLHGAALTGTAATIEVKSGTLAFPAGNNLTSLVGGGTFAVSNNATLNLAPDSNTGTYLDGDFTGVGGGTVLLNAGILNCGVYTGSSSLNLPGNMFQWTGGQLVTGVFLTNNGTINISNNPGFTGNGYLFNKSLIKLADGSALGVNSGTLGNQTGGTIDCQGDSGLSGNAIFYNSGLLKKSAGTGISQIFPRFLNYGGTVEVDTGTLAVNIGISGNVISNATFIVQSGATLELSISNFNSEIEGVLTGSGGGTVFMNDGAVFCYHGVTLNFPGSMFQWAGGSLGGESSAFLTNDGTISLSGPARMDQYFANNGTIIQGGAGGIGGKLAQFANNVGGVYQIQNDNGVAINIFNNYGRLEKTGESGTSVIDATVNNSGAIQATSGTLLFTGGPFNQNAGTLQITPSITFTNQAFNLNGGTVTGEGTLGDINVVVNGGVLAPGNPFGTLNVPFAFNLYSGAFNVVLGGTNQFSQLAVGGNAGFGFLNCTLNVTLTNGYAPAIGTQFKILSCANLGGGFAALNVPEGISVNYSNNGVYLVMTGPAPAQLQSPQVTGGNFNFSFGTMNGWSYTVQQNTNLATTNWTFYTNITGNGSLYQFSVPVTNIPPGFFRVSQP